ncbi:MAG: tryptophan--tRNA ligase [bacterium]
MKKVFSGIQPTGVIHIGNYIGALKNWVKMQNEYECVYCIVDNHAITSKQEKEELKKNIIYTAKICLAAGIDPKKSLFFVQSDVPEHAELTWILNCYTYFGELRRMTQFKEKAGSSQEGSCIGLLDYPVLMASDILLYQTDAVPVGEDQQQHLELTRTIARRVNNIYGSVFKIPEAIINTLGARIMGLDDPTKKMSKSAHSEYNYIAVDDKAESISRKIQFAVTDSGKDVLMDEERKPAVTNLITLYTLFSGISISDIEKKYLDCGYSAFKKDLAQVVIDGLKSIREKMLELDGNEGEIKKILKENAVKARETAQKTLNDLKSKIGLGSG